MGGVVCPLGGLTLLGQISCTLTGARPWAPTGQDDPLRVKSNFGFFTTAITGRPAPDHLFFGFSAAGAALITRGALARFLDSSCPKPGSDPLLGQILK